MVLRALRRGRRGRAPAVDPFVVLRVQMSLARLDAEVRELGGDARRFARAHKLKVALAAYDEVLLEACRLAGIDPPQERSDALRRLLAESQLRAAGWDW